MEEGQEKRRVGRMQGEERGFKEKENREELKRGTIRGLREGGKERRVMEMIKGNKGQVRGRKKESRVRHGKGMRRRGLY